MDFATQTKDGARLNLHVQPGAKKNEICGTRDKSLKIKLQAPPVDGKANEALVRFIAETLSVPKKSVSLVSGEKSRDKTVLIKGAEAEEAARRLIELSSEK